MTDTTGPAPEQRSWIVRLWTWFWRPARATALGVLLMLGFAVGILFWGGFHWALELTNTEEFCISCHEMKSNVFAEYRTTVHYANGSGVRASCPDCHVPKEWHYKIMRKIQASNELYHHVLGSVATPEKFNDKRLDLALNEWSRMKTTDSRECRNCHKFESMDYALQEPRASKTHQEALTAGKTCIDCHRGIAHKLPPRANEAYQKLVESLDKGDHKVLSDYLQSQGSPAKASVSK
ncbi:MAG: NapC/NirT family cytochrome c [Hyphomicrobiales bacterium]|nr:NapC/NirT family cytochrome c [Hyphomicrobiales bacterium]